MGRYLQIAALVRDVSDAVARLRRRMPQEHETIAALYSLTGRDSVAISTLRQHSQEDRESLEAFEDRYRRAAELLASHQHMPQLSDETLRDLLAALRDA